MSIQNLEFPPVLILGFNRPHHLRRLIHHLRTIAPPVIYCAQDGPRENKPTDRELCAQVTAIWDEIDWKCEKHMLRRDKNAGCQLGVSSAISWFFSKEEAGIILEDDCIPDKSFFQFCSQLLTRYKQTPTIMHISGDNFCPNSLVPTESSYRFSHYPHCWGWATWRRAWEKFDVSLTSWPEKKKNGWLQQRFSSPIARFFWSRMFDGVYNKKIDSWAIAWVFSCWNENGIAVLPNKNLVRNIGFDMASTHTPDPHSPLANRTAYTLSFPLQHPGTIQVNSRCDGYDQRFVYEQRTPQQLLSFALRKIQRLFSYA